MKYLWLLLVSGLFLALQLAVAPSVDMLLIGLIVVAFFYDEWTSIAYVLISGIFRGIFYPLFGFHLVLYGIEALLAIILINTIITHRSFLGFTGIAWSILLMHLLLTSVFLFIIGYILPPYMFFSPSLGDFLESVISICIVYALSSVGYFIVSRMQYTRRYGMIIDRV